MHRRFKIEKKGGNLPLRITFNVLALPFTNGTDCSLYNYINFTTQCRRLKSFVVGLMIRLYHSNQKQGEAEIQTVLNLAWFVNPDSTRDGVFLLFIFLSFQYFHRSFSFLGLCKKKTLIDINKLN